MKNLLKRKIPCFLLLFLALPVFFLSGLIGFAEKSPDEKHLDWLTYEQALAKSKIEDIHTLIYFYSDRCSWCRKLENETFTDQAVSQLMKKDFAITKINSNSSELVVENGEKITEQKLSQEIYQVRANPTIWFLTSDQKRVAPLPGYVPVEDFINVLDYIKGGYYKDNTSFQQYMKDKEKK